MFASCFAIFQTTARHTLILTTGMKTGSLSDGFVDLSTGFQQVESRFGVDSFHPHGTRYVFIIFVEEI